MVHQFYVQRPLEVAQFAHRVECPAEDFNTGAAPLWATLEVLAKEHPTGTVVEVRPPMPVHVKYSELPEEEVAFFVRRTDGTFGGLPKVARLSDLWGFPRLVLALLDQATENTCLAAESNDDAIREGLPLVVVTSWLRTHPLVRAQAIPPELWAGDVFRMQLAKALEDEATRKRIYEEPHEGVKFPLAVLLRWASVSVERSRLAGS